MIKRIGYACKTSFVNVTGEIASIPKYNFGSTTIAWLNRQSKDTAYRKLLSLLKDNTIAARELIKYISELPMHLRMVRIGSDWLPAYTHSDWKEFYKQPDVERFISREFAKIGDFARHHNIKLSMHPGQFCCLSSENPGIVENSIEEFEYHADIARWLGYGKQFQDFKINIHISGKRGPAGMIESYNKLSPEARNCITIENEENAWGLNDCLSISNIIPVVIDLHHHFVREGEYISPDDQRVKMVIDSWRDVRPTLHYSLSRDDYISNCSPESLPSLSTLIQEGYKKQKLRAHSDYMWNTAANKWALSFTDNFDIMVEAKAKNLASFKLAEFGCKINAITAG